MKRAPGEVEEVVERDEFKCKLPKKIIKQLHVMSEFSKVSIDEMVETAIKRYISSHSDYFPNNKIE
jgi:hypothetical protein